jgi:hypothetical protein
MRRVGGIFRRCAVAIALDGLVLAGGCGTGDTASTNGAKGAPALGVGVNSFLWRAALDTISFMPLSSADPFGGVIITDWYTPPESTEERFKMTIYILDRQLRADGVRVAVFKQRRARGGWADVAVDPRTAADLENQILTRARTIRLQSRGGTG